MLGARTPELALIALRLTLAGCRADDEAVKRLRDVLGKTNGATAEAKRAREEYEAILKERS